jgi:hypothetical protein
MTQLGGDIPEGICSIRNSLSEILDQYGINEIDATTSTTGRDFLSKIWKKILGVPFGIAIVTSELKLGTIANIFYEIGILNALGKETIVIKSNDFQIPSDFIRTEYINFDKSFKTKISGFIRAVLELADYYDTIAENLENNPSLSIDYWRRAYLISGDFKYLEKARVLFLKNNFDNQTKLYIKNFLSCAK